MRTELKSLTDKEREEMLFYSEERAEERVHEIKVRELELAVEKELTKLKTILKIPRMLIMTPVMMVVAIAVVVNALKGKDQGEILNLFK